MASIPSSGETKEDNDVMKLLRELKLEDYFQKFMDEGYDTLDRLENIVLEDLIKDIGLKKGHARQFLRKIENPGESFSSPRSSRSSSIQSRSSSLTDVLGETKGSDNDGTLIVKQYR